MKKIILGLCCYLLLMGSVNAQCPAQLELNVGIHRIDAEVACLESERQQGLMFRTQLPPQRGMLFVFSQAQPWGFWMKNTSLPLTIAFLDADGVIVDLADLQPFSMQERRAKKPALFALEMNQGWFSQRHVRIGERIYGIPRGLRGQ